MKRTIRLPLTSLEARESHAVALQALSHLTRLRIFFFLVRRGGETPAGEIQQAVGIPGPTLSHHLEKLQRAGLLERRREERFVLYSVRREIVSELVRLFTACC
jgi:DNA-binding transcriptional ArsR family regulator